MTIRQQFCLHGSRHDSSPAIVYLSSLPTMTERKTVLEGGMKQKNGIVPGISLFHEGVSDSSEKTLQSPVISKSPVNSEGMPIWYPFVDAESCFRSLYFVYLVNRSLVQ